jgi:hypothetical protein
MCGNRKSSCIVWALFHLVYHIDHQFYTTLHFYPLFLMLLMLLMLLFLLMLLIKSSCHFFEFSFCLTGARVAPPHHRITASPDHQINAHTHTTTRIPAPSNGLVSGMTLPPHTSRRTDPGLRRSSRPRFPHS